MQIVNCRDDSLTCNKPTFRKPKESQRCIVLAEGFFEWKRPEKQGYFVFPSPEPLAPVTTATSESKEPHRALDTPNEKRPLLYMGALYRTEHDPDTKEPIMHYCIITTPVAKNLTFLHDRMPLILSSETDRALWLNSTLSFELVQHLVKPTESGLDWYAVSALVNNVRNQTLECIVPIDKKNVVTKTSSGMKKASPGQKSTIKDFFRSAISSPSQQERTSPEKLSAIEETKEKRKLNKEQYGASSGTDLDSSQQEHVNKKQKQEHPMAEKLSPEGKHKLHILSSSSQ